MCITLPRAGSAGVPDVCTSLDSLCGPSGCKVSIATRDYAYCPVYTTFPQQ